MLAQYGECNVLLEIVLLKFELLGTIQEVTRSFIRLKCLVVRAGLLRRCLELLVGDGFFILVLSCYMNGRKGPAVSREIFTTATRARNKIAPRAKF